MHACYACLPIMLQFDKIDERDNYSIVAVVAPLTAIIHA